MNQLRWMNPAAISLIMLFISLVPRYKADVNAESNERGWVQTKDPYRGRVDTLYVTPEGVLSAGTGGAGVFCSIEK